MRQIVGLITLTVNHPVKYAYNKEVQHLCHKLKYLTFRMFVVYCRCTDFIKRFSCPAKTGVMGMENLCNEKRFAALTATHL